MTRPQLASSLPVSRSLNRRAPYPLGVLKLNALPPNLCTAAPCQLSTRPAPSTRGTGSPHLPPRSLGHSPLRRPLSGEPGSRGWGGGAVRTSFLGSTAGSSWISHPSRASRPQGRGRRLGPPLSLTELVPRLLCSGLRQPFPPGSQGGACRPPTQSPSAPTLTVRM